jgi:hydrogenase expression/formation protein HypD
MKYLEEYRDAKVVKHYLDAIHNISTQEWSVMEICGGQTHSLVKHGIIDLLPHNINMIHGPGCPVCVTPQHLIDQAVRIAHEQDSILCSFGDMLRVPGTKGSLLNAKANGAQVQIVYSPLEAVNLAMKKRDKNIVFFAVGFETTAPANALAVLQASRLGLDNFSLLMSHVLVPPAMKALLNDPETKIDAFLAAGHVCAVMGSSEYQPIVSRFQVPIVITGFEPVDLLRGLHSCLLQLEGGEASLENQYARVVKEEGNLEAKKIIHEVFEVADRSWRGIGLLPESGFAIHSKYKKFDANLRFSFEAADEQDQTNCIAGDILKGLKKPASCSQFGKACTPENPLGAPMVSSEGACAAYFHYTDIAHE